MYFIRILAFLLHFGSAIFISVVTVTDELLRLQHLRGDPPAVPAAYRLGDTTPPVRRMLLQHLTALRRGVSRDGVKRLRAAGGDRVGGRELPRTV